MLPTVSDAPLRSEHTFVYDRPMTDYDLAQRSVLRTLLEAHPRLLDVGELDDRLPDIPRVREALRVLTDDGLATRLGDRVGVSRAAVRFDALNQPV
jgi:hypothetical protein